MKTYFVISDIHGKGIDLEMFEDKGFHIDNPNHLIVLLGDYFDRGNNNSEVYRWILDTRSILKDRLITLIGNHEGMIINVFNEVLEHPELDYSSFLELRTVQLWIRNGGDTTIRDLLGNTLDIDKLEELHEFVKTLDVYYETSKYILTHASINSSRESDYWNRDMIYTENTTNKMCVIGHTPHCYLDPQLIEFKEMGQGIVAMHKILNNKVINIDDGSNQNIVVFTE